MTREFRFVAGALGIVFLAAGCSEPLAPLNELTSARVILPATVELARGDGQSAAAGTRTGVSPAVLVRDSSGNALSDVEVRFVVVRGGGTVERASARTDASGVAEAGRWTLGTTVGSNELEATVGSLPAVRFGATSFTPAPPPGAFQIQVRYVGAVTVRQAAAVTAAIARWQAVIVGDLGDVPLSAPAASCFPNQPAVNETIDDLLLFVEFTEIDGPGAVLGQAGPCYIRSDTGLPVLGYLKLDVADLLKMEQAGTLDDVVLHEIGHVLGIGTLWTHSSMMTGAGTADPFFTGTRAVGAYRGLGGGAIGVPVENTGGAGTRDSHWREAEFGNELMTGFISGPGNPLSALTAASLVDIGYNAVTTTASSYTLGGTRSGIVAGDGVDLHAHEVLVRPRFKVDKYGRKYELPE